MMNFVKKSYATFGKKELEDGVDEGVKDHDNKQDGEVDDRGEEDCAGVFAFA